MGRLAKQSLMVAADFALPFFGFGRPILCDLVNGLYPVRGNHCRGAPHRLTLNHVAGMLSERLVNLFRRGPDGRIPAFPPDSPFQYDPWWRDTLQFHEYFHAETGQGIGASHQTGWTALVANLLLRLYRDQGRSP